MPTYMTRKLEEFEIDKDTKRKNYFVDINIHAKSKKGGGAKRGWRGTLLKFDSIFG